MITLPSDAPRGVPFAECRSARNGLYLHGQLTSAIDAVDASVRQDERPPHVFSYSSISSESHNDTGFLSRLPRDHAVQASGSVEKIHQRVVNNSIIP